MFYDCYICEKPLSEEDFFVELPDRPLIHGRICELCFDSIPVVKGRFTLTRHGRARLRAILVDGAVAREAAS